MPCGVWACQVLTPWRAAKRSCLDGTQAALDRDIGGARRHLTLVDGSEDVELSKEDDLGEVKRHGIDGVVVIPRASLEVAPMGRDLLREARLGPELRLQVLRGMCRRLGELQ